MRLRQLSRVVTLGLLVDKPPVKPVGMCNLRQLSYYRKTAVLILRQEGVQPLQLTAVRRLREKAGSDHLHAILMRHIRHVRARRNNQALARGAAPVHKQIHILQITEGVRLKAV